LVLAALAEAEKSNATVSAILTIHVHDRTAVEREIQTLILESAAQVHEVPEEYHVFPHIAAVRVKAHPPLIRALLSRPEVERANSGLTQAPFAFSPRTAGKS
jgi:hypothetical protein